MYKLDQGKVTVGSRIVFDSVLAIKKWKSSQKIETFNNINEALNWPKGQM
jgi:hypothetical protein